MIKTVPKRLIQISKVSLPSHVIKLSMKHCKKWEYLHFDDEAMLSYIMKNPLPEFPNLVNVLQSFRHGAHKADLFRYYYLYLNGGVYLDSDAILEKKIERIIEDHSFTTIKAYHNNEPLIFNGFLACPAGNPVIYEALKRTYKMDPATLESDYHAICKDLLNILSENSYKNVQIHQEIKNDEFYAGVKSVNIHNECLVTHYCYIKRIPKINMLNEWFYRRVVFGRLKPFKAYKRLFE